MGYFWLVLFLLFNNLLIIKLYFYHTVFGTLPLDEHILRIYWGNTPNALFGSLRIVLSLKPALAKRTTQPNANDSTMEIRRKTRTYTILSVQQSRLRPEQAWGIRSITVTRMCADDCCETPYASFKSDNGRNFATQAQHPKALAKHSKWRILK